MRAYPSSLSIIVGVSMLVAAAMGGPASAAGTPQQRAACMGDAFRFCSRDIPDVARIEACLLQNRERLHPACQAEFDGGSSRLQADHFR